jgi:hypothetical protein
LEVSLKLTRIPTLNRWATVVIQVVSIEDAPRTHLELLLPEGVRASSRPSWILNLKKNKSVTRSARLKFMRPGNLQIHAVASREAAPDLTWQDVDTLSLSMSANGQGAPGWSLDWIGVAAPGEDTFHLAMASRVSQGSAPAILFPVSSEHSEDEVPAVYPQESEIAFPSAPQSQAAQSPGNFTITGKWRYHDRNLPTPIERDVDQQLIEMRKGNGLSLIPRCFGYTTATGNYSLTCPHTGTNDYRVWVWSRTSLNCSGPNCPNLLGVFNGPETPGGCDNSTEVNCAYPVTTPVVMCADGAVCNGGTWVVHRTNTGEPWVGAHQMTQDLMRSWKRIFFATKHTSAIAGPGPIDYPVPNGHGTHAHVGQSMLDGKVWISIPPGSQLSADVVVHEYGHVVMHNVYEGTFPTNDCPTQHFITLPGAPNCGWTEGFADFWSLFSNQLYDGDGLATNNGPIFNFVPNRSGVNLETRNIGMFGDGDWVEGNVASALWDIYDTLNDNKPGAGTDLLSNGISHIWHALEVQSDNTFAEWWLFFQNPIHVHPNCAALQALWNNTISNRPEYLPSSSCNVFLSPTPTPVPLNVEAIQHSLIVSENRVKFEALGKGIKSIQVQILDLAGTKVFDSDRNLGNNLSWNLLNAQSHRVARGVYLYVVTVRGFDEASAIRSHIQKLVIQ